MARIDLRLSDDKKAEWLMKSEAAGLSLTALIGHAVDGIPLKRRKVRSIDPALLRQLALIGNNLNQIARWANHHKGGADAMAVISVLVELDREVGALRKDLETLSDAD